MSVIRPIVAMVAVLAFTQSVHAKPVTYTIGTKLSRVTFQIEHQGFISLFGTIRVAPGTIVFDQDDWAKSSASVSMPTRSIDMGDATWNQALRGDDSWDGLFKYPAITFRATRLEHTLGMQGKMYGELSMAGVTKPVVLDLHVNKIGKNQVSEYESIGFTASTMVKRSAFGLNAYSDLVGDDLGIQIQIEAAVGQDPDAAHDQSAAGTM